MVPKAIFLICVHLACFFYCTGQQHEVFFCGERIPIEREFVADNLMNVIRKQVPLANLPSLRKRAELYFPTVEKYLRMYGIPLDLKYLPIVESGFVENARSRVGAYGFWPIMPGTAGDLGLVIDSGSGRDDRTGRK